VSTETQQLVNDATFLQSDAAPGSVSLLFLQGDYGDCFYIVVRGGIGLYVQKSTEKENENSRDIGCYRGLPLPNPAANLEAMGECVANLTAGAGFGEMALLSPSRRYRGASAVILPNSLLLVVPEQCYNSIFRRHHLRQQKMAEGLAVLEKLPFFQGCSYAKVVQVAFSIQSVTLGRRKGLVKAGDAVESAFVIAKVHFTIKILYVVSI
jgi:CRP-like cAMP-binding protein